MTFLTLVLTLESSPARKRTGRVDGPCGHMVPQCVVDAAASPDGWLYSVQIER